MSCDDNTIEFNNGDEVAQEFTMRDADGNVVDLTDITVTAEVWWRGKKRITLAVGTGIVIIDPNPATAPDPEDQMPHGTITLTETQAATLPFGRVAYLKVIAVDVDGLTTSTKPVFFDKQLP